MGAQQIMRLVTLIQWAEPGFRYRRDRTGVTRGRLKAPPWSRPAPKAAAVRLL
jgi:hypothetical protein